MKIVIIRHGDPDYSIDSLTEKGWREAEMLSERVLKMDVSEFFVSPLGRARDTANVSLKKLGREATVCDWLREFPGYAVNQETGKHEMPWDYLPADWTTHEELFRKDEWLTSPRMAAGDVAEKFDDVCRGIDGILEKYGYVRDGNMYRTNEGKTDTVVLFCHLGAGLAVAGHLMGIAPVLLWQSCYVAPTSVTTLVSEERVRGEVFFRCTGLGDISHLYKNNEPMSLSGFFEEAR